MTNLITGEVFGQERDAPRAFLISEAEKPFDSLTPAVQAARDNLVASLQGMTDAQLRFEPGGGSGEEGWGAARIVNHVLGGEARLILRLKALANGEPLPAFSGPLQAEDDGSSASALIDKLAASRAQLASVVASVAGKERLDTTANHAMFGELNCRAWYRLQGLHEDDHARQIQRLKTTPGFPTA